MIGPSQSVCVLVTLSVASLAVAQVPVNKEPHHRVVFENAQLRVLDVTVPARTMTASHRHDRDIATVSISPADTRTISPGQPWGPIRPRRSPGNTATTEYTGIPGVHTIENVGSTVYRLIAVENLRDGNWSAGAPLNGTATTLALDSRAFRVYDVRLTPSVEFTRHVHTAPAVVVLVSGGVLAGDTSPQRLDRPGRWLVVSQGQIHQLAPDGDSDAHVVEIEVR